MPIQFTARSRPAALISLAVACAALACSSLPGVVETSAPLAPAPLTLSGGVGVVNNSGETICYLYISPTTSDTWGDSWLGTAGAIEDGGTQTFDVASGDYDLRAEDCDTGRLAEARSVSISDSGYLWTIPYVPVTLRMVNNSGSTVCYVFISPSTDSAWGGDWLGRSETIGPGGSRNFAVPPGQDFDMMAADCDQNTLHDQRGIAISDEITTWTIPAP